MDLAIIGAGIGSRLKSGGISVPKPLLKINGVCMIDRIINASVNNGIEEIYCILNEQSPQVAEHLAKNDYGVDIHINIKTTQSSMHSLFELSEFLTKPFLMTTVDTIFDENEYSEYVNYISNNTDADVILGITNYIDDEKPLCVELNSKAKIISFHDSKENHIWATGGIYSFNPKIFNMIDYALKTQISRLRNFLRLLLNEGYEIEGFKFSKIIDVDHAEDIETAENFLTSNN